MIKNKNLSFRLSDKDIVYLNLLRDYFHSKYHTNFNISEMFRSLIYVYLLDDKDFLKYLADHNFFKDYGKVELTFKL